MYYHSIAEWKWKNKNTCPKKYRLEARDLIKFLVLQKCTWKLNNNKIYSDKTEIKLKIEATAKQKTHKVLALSRGRGNS